MEGYIWINTCSYEGIVVEIEDSVKDGMAFFTLAQKLTNGRVDVVKVAAFGATSAVVARKIQLGTHMIAIGKLKNVNRKSTFTNNEYHGARIVLEDFRILGKEREWRERLAAEYKEQHKTDFIKARRSILSKKQL